MSLYEDKTFLNIKEDDYYVGIYRVWSNFNSIYGGSIISGIYNYHENDEQQEILEEVYVTVHDSCKRFNFRING